MAAESKSKFNVGDTVRCVDPAYSLKKDALYTITAVRDMESICDVKDDGFYKETGFYTARFELVDASIVSTELRPGSKVKFKNYSKWADWQWHTGEVATLTRLDTEDKWSGTWDDGYTFGSLSEDNIINLAESAKENKKMASAIEIMNLELDADTQLLRREGIEDSCGALTTTGLAVLNRVLYLENKKAIVAKVKEAVAARKAVGADLDEDDD